MGCRINFDDVAGDARAGDGPAGDVVFGHNEDGDAFADVDDFCPHIASATNVDGDGDLVGDICDAEPTLARQTWLSFSPMTGPIPFAAGPATAWTMNADDWHFTDPASSTQAQLIRTGMVANLDVWVGLDIEVVGPGNVQAAIIINGSIPYWYGELFEATADARITIMEYDGSAFVARSSSLTGAPFPIGPVDLHLAARPGVSLTIEGAGTSAVYSTPGYAGDNQLLLAFSNLTGRVRYIAIVTSQ